MALVLVTPTDVLAFAPELSKLDDQAVAEILILVNEVNLVAKGATAQEDRMAKIFLAAHIGALALRARSGAAGPVTSESVGGIRRSYGLIATSGTGAFATTRYGQMYLDILGMTVVHGPMVI